MLFRYYTGQFRVNHDTTAIFANDNFLTHANIQLLLRRNLVKTTATCIALYINNTQTITRVLTDTFKRIRKNSRNGLGIVYVQRDACGGCFNKIPPQKQLDIRMRKKIIVCEYCGRIMIDPELAGVVSEQHLESVKK